MKFIANSGVIKSSDGIRDEFRKLYAQIELELTDKVALPGDKSSCIIPNKEDKHKGYEDMT